MIEHRTHATNMNMPFEKLFFNNPNVCISVDDTRFEFYCKHIFDIQKISNVVTFGNFFFLFRNTICYDNIPFKSTSSSIEK